MRKNAFPSPFGYLLIIGIFLVSRLYLVGAIQEWQVREYLRQQGTPAEATIVERSEQFRDFSVKYSFIPSGKDVAMTRRERINVFYYFTYLKDTDKVSILYDPADAKISRIVGDNNFIASGLFAMGGMAVAVYLAVILTKALLKLHKDTRKLDEPG